MDDEEYDEMENQGLFGGLGRGIDLDALMRDIDAKIAELDAMEEAEKEKEKEEEKASEE